MFVPAFSFRIPPIPQSMQAVTRNLGWLLASKGLASVLSLVSLALITRSLGISDFGKFALITAAAQLIASALAINTWQVVVQFGVHHVENGEEERLARLMKAAVVLDLASAWGGIGVTFATLHFFGKALGMNPSLIGTTMAFSAIMLLSLRSSAIGILRLRDRFDYAAMADSARFALRAAGALLAYLFHPTLQGFLLVWAAAELLSAAAHWYGVHRLGDWNVIWSRENGVGQVVPENPGIIRYALTASFSQTLHVSTRQIPLFFVGGLVGTAAAGAFRLAAQLCRALSAVAQLIATAVFPEIVRAVRRQGVESLRPMIARSALAALAVCSAIFAVAVFAGKAILIAIGGEDFVIAYPSLLWLAAAACIDVVAVALEPSLFAANRPHLALLARLFATAVLVMGIWLLTLVMGAAGVAAAVFAGSLGHALLLGSFMIGLLCGSRPGQRLAGPL